ncbi:N-6 DNA methylase [Curtobacterium sp. 1P10AnD]|uniref:HsdM family class I SAM-dependent methyltransferase n=1 Tax=Curtobacterium sp. 1P10AnD TaxID=3132283 RepID=UPI00399FBAEC
MPQNVAQTSSGPEHVQVRQPAIDALLAAGWNAEQLQWQPEWRVPKTPHDAAKRERGAAFDGWPVDLVLFDDVRGAGDWRHAAVICEFKQPNLHDGISQLEIYLQREPRAKLGFWSNGTRQVRVYKLPDGNFAHEIGKGLPKPQEQLERSALKPITYEDLRVPTVRELTSTFKRLLDVVVSRDSRATRSENQLDQLCNMLLLKLESDTNAELQPGEDVEFQLPVTHAIGAAQLIRAHFKQLVLMRPEVFAEFDGSELLLDDHTITDIVYELSGLNLIKVGSDAIATAFQVFRRANLKAGDGQYFTPQRVVSAAVQLMDLQPTDRIIDPACGTGGFLVEAFMAMQKRAEASSGEAAARTWAHRQVFGVDKDGINIKLARAIMVSLGDGSVNIHTGDSLSEDRWAVDYPHLPRVLADGSFTVVLTNPPFGINLKYDKRDARRNRYSLAQKGGENYADVELGLIFLERAYRLLMTGGRLGIILPESYFFSSTYEWLALWIRERFIMRGALNIPMEAFQGFCRAKTNFYVMEKR